MNFVCKNISVCERTGHLTFAGQDTVSLAEKYGTPLYLFDEDRLRENCRRYMSAFQKSGLPGFRVIYAGKAAAFKQMYRIMREEGMAVDLVSPGEIATAKAAGFPMELSYFHGNNKTDSDIRFAFDAGVGYFVAESEEELEAIEEEAKKRGVVQKVLIRVTPGIDPHTYEAVATGKVDSKFGLAIVTGQAEAAVACALSLPHVKLMGFHCHVGSMVFAEDVYERTVKVMMEFADDMRQKFGYIAEELNLGGGIGVPYTEADAVIDLDEKITSIADAFRAACAERDFPAPMLLVEPGRSIAADAGMTLYTVGSIKKLPGYKNYVSVDGGMTDNPRFALYRSSYTCLPANRMKEPRDMQCSVVGRCCESGDIIQENVPMPETLARGDLLAVCTTGAYNYSMASNYNRVCRPPVVMLKGGDSYVAVRRETEEDIMMYDL